MSDGYEPKYIVIKSANYLFSGYSAILGLLTPGFFSLSKSGFMELAAHFSASILMMVGFWLNATHAPNLNYVSISSAAVLMIGGTFGVFTTPLFLVLCVYLGLGVLSHVLKTSYTAKLDILSILYSTGVGIFLIFSSAYMFFE